MTRVSRRELLGQAAVALPAAVMGGGALAMDATSPSLGATSEDIVAMYETLTPDGRADFLAVGKIISKYDLRWQSFESIGAMLERMTAHSSSIVDPHLAWAAEILRLDAIYEREAEGFMAIERARRLTDAEWKALDRLSTQSSDDEWVLLEKIAGTPARTAQGAIAQLRAWLEKSERSKLSMFRDELDLRAYRLALSTLEQLTEAPQSALHAPLP